MKTCAVEGCGREFVARGYCGRHYARMRRFGDLRQRKINHGDRLKWVEEVALKSETDDCVLFPYGQSGKYFIVMVDKKRIYGHKYTCEKIHGAPPSPVHEAAHSCGKDKCCNPRHLRWAPHIENCADRKLHGTHHFGATVNGATLNDEKVLEMRRLKGRMKYKEIAALYGVTRETARRAIVGISWTHLPLKG